MGRFPTLDKWLAGVLLACWAAAFPMAVVDAVQGAGISPLYARVAEEPDGYPSLVRFRPYAPGDRVLRPGDRLIQAGEADLRGLGAIGVFFRITEQSRNEPTVLLVYERDGERRETPLALYPVGSYVGMLPASLSIVVCVLILLLRAAPEPVLRLGVPAGLFGALMFCTISVGPLWWLIASNVMLMIATAFSGPLIVLAAMRFPNSTPIRSPWARRLPWLYVGMVPLVMTIAYGWEPVPLDFAFAAYTPLAGTIMIWSVAAVTRNYRRADPVGRRQVKWPLASAYVGLMPLWIAIGAVMVVGPKASEWVMDATALLALVPIGVTVGVMRYDLFDVDRLITATTSYTCSSWRAWASC